MQTKKNKNSTVKRSTNNQQSYIPKFDGGGFGKWVTNPANADMVTGIGSGLGMGMNVLSSALETPLKNGTKGTTAGSNAMKYASAVTPLATNPALIAATGGASLALPLLAMIPGAIMGAQIAKKDRRMEKAAGINENMQQVQEQDMQYAKYGGYVKKYDDGGGIKEDMIKYTSVGQHNLSNTNLQGLDLDLGSGLLPEVEIVADRIVKHNYNSNMLNAMGMGVLNSILSKEDADKKNKIPDSKYKELLNLLMDANSDDYRKGNLRARQFANIKNEQRRQGFIPHAEYGGNYAQPIQTAKGERVVDKYGNLKLTNSNMPHSSLPENLATDMLSPGEFVFSANSLSPTKLAVVEKLIGQPLEAWRKYGKQGKNESPASLAAAFDSTVKDVKTKSYQFSTPARNNFKKLGNGTEEYPGEYAKLKAHNEFVNPKNIAANFSPIMQPVTGQMLHAAFGGSIPHYGLGGKDDPTIPYDPTYDASQASIMFESPYYPDFSNPFLSPEHIKENPASITTTHNYGKSTYPNYNIPDGTSVTGEEYASEAAQWLKAYKNTKSRNSATTTDPTTGKSSIFDPRNIGANIAYSLSTAANLLNRPQSMYLRATPNNSGLYNTKTDVRIDPQIHAILAAQNAGVGALSGTANWKNFAANAANITANTQSALNDAYSKNNALSMDLYNHKMGLIQQMNMEKFKNDQNILVDQTAVRNANSQLIPKAIQQGVSDAGTFIKEKMALNQEQLLMLSLMKVMPNMGDFVAEMVGMKATPATTTPTTGTLPPPPTFQPFTWQPTTPPRKRAFSSFYPK